MIRYSFVQPSCCNGKIITSRGGCGCGDGDASRGGGIDFGEEDLALEEALWALYQRWSAEYKVQRDAGEKLRLFDIFKKRAAARFVHDFNKLGNASFTLG
jgi:hypothetical protein